MARLLVPLLPWALALPAVLAPPAAGVVAAADCSTFALGVLTMGDVDDIRSEACFGIACAAIVRSATVTVGFTPSSPADIVRVEVRFSGLPQGGFLTFATPSLAFAGTAPDSCITPVTLAALVVASAAPYEVRDASLGAGV